MPSRFVKTMNRNCLKENIESAMNYLSKEQLKRILVEPQDYITSLRFVGAGFSRNKGKYETCMKVYRQLYESDESKLR